MTQFADNEDLSKNSLLEIDFDEMTRSHLTGADQSCPGLSVCLSVCSSHSEYRSPVFTWLCSELTFSRFTNHSYCRLPVVRD